MLIRTLSPTEHNELIRAFKVPPPGPTHAAVIVVCEEGKSVWAYAWAEPVEDTAGAWEMKGWGVAKGKEGHGLEGQVILTLEIELEKREARKVWAWCPADLDASIKDLRRDALRAREWRFREYVSDHFGQNKPGDRHERVLSPGGFPSDRMPHKKSRAKKGTLKFPLLGMN